MSGFSYGIVTVSDSCYSSQATDESGPAIKFLLQQHYNALKISQSTVPDDKIAIEGMLKYYSDELYLNCILTTGGTGFAPRDVTPEATKNIIHRECPQLALAMALESLKKTPFAALSRAICGIRNKTLIINLPGSKKAVVECFGAIQAVIPHAIELICDEKGKTIATHKVLQREFNFSVPVDCSSIIPHSNSSKMSEVSDIVNILDQSSSSIEEIILNDDIKKLAASKHVIQSEKSVSSDTESERFQVLKPRHVCPHKTSEPGDEDDRNSPFPMLDVDVAVKKILSTVKRLNEPIDVRSPMNCPPFRASIKDGYAVKSTCKSKTRFVIGYISAGDQIMLSDFADNECFKINTGAAIPKFADAIVQVEDTKLIGNNEDGSEYEIQLLQLPKVNCDVRDIGSDMAIGELLFRTNGTMSVPEKTILASVGLGSNQKMPKIAIISTGDELVDPSDGELREGQIYDSNSTMLKLLLEKFGLTAKSMEIAKDDYESLKRTVQNAMMECNVIISSGGVSMGDKDFVKPLMEELGFEIHFGRVNMKPGKPMTFASTAETSYFALPGNPVSAFVTFHLFVLPALRFMCGFPEAKCKLPVINAILQKDKYVLDSRPEYARARITYSNGKGIYYAHVPDNQMSSRLATLINADVLLHLPGASGKMVLANRGFKTQATILSEHFVSEYLP